VIENLVALTGIEPAGRQFSSVQLGLSSCVFGLVQFATKAFRPLRVADVLPRCCPAGKTRLLKIPLRAGDPRLADLPGGHVTVPGPNRLHSNRYYRNIGIGYGHPIAAKTQASRFIAERRCNVGVAQLPDTP
jgi:hypothetical protein